MRGRDVLRERPIEGRGVEEGGENHFFALGSFNQTRKTLGLAPYDSFGDLTDDSILRKNLKQVYGHIGALDLSWEG
jgi:hypothetical protein